MRNDVILNKVQVVERCIRRVNEEYENNPDNLKDFTRQDSIILNIQRACEACIDLAMHIVSEKELGIPQSSREVLHILRSNGIIHNGLAARLKAMVGFRNIAVHDYQQLNLAIVQEIIEKHLADLKAFCSRVLQL